MDLVKNKKIILTGLLNKRSIAYGVARVLSKQGAILGLTCQSEKIKSKLIKQLDKDNIKYDFIELLDVTKKEDIDNLSEKIKSEWITFDGLLHSIAFAPIDSFNKSFLSINSEEFLNSINISAVSLHTLVSKLHVLMNKYSSIVSLSFDTDKYVPNYNIMSISKKALESISLYMGEELGEHSIRINILRSSPIQTLASSVIPKPKDFFQKMKDSSMIKEELNSEDIGNTCLFLFSDLSKKITGETINIDCGLSKKILPKK